MKTKLLTICLLLFTSISWSGEIDGKSIICDKRNGYKFVSEKIEMDRITELNRLEFGIKYFKLGSYITTHDFIKWKTEVWFRLNRKTLVLEQESMGKYIYLMQCEVMPNIKAYNKQMEKYVQEYIKEFNRKDKILRKGNKI